MREKDLLRAMSDIREDYILEAAPDAMPEKVIPIWRRRGFRAVSGLAAVFLLFVIGIGVFRMNHLFPQQGSMPKEEMVQEEYREEYDDADAQDQMAGQSAQPVEDQAGQPMEVDEVSAEKETETETETETESEV